MSEKSRNDLIKPPKNTLLSGAGFSFPFENFSNSALLVPVPLNNEQTLAPQLPDGEGDTFVGQDNPPPAAPPPATAEPVSRPLSVSSSVSSLFSQFTNFSLSSINQTSPVSESNSNLNGSASSSNQSLTSQSATPNFYNTIQPASFYTGPQPPSQQQYNQQNQQYQLYNQQQNQYNQNQPLYQHFPPNQESNQELLGDQATGVKFYQPNLLGLANQPVTSLGLDQQSTNLAPGSSEPLQSVPLLNPTDQLQSVPLLNSSDPLQSVPLLNSSDRLQSVPLLNPTDPLQSVSLLNPSGPLQSVPSLKPSDPLQSNPLLNPTESPSALTIGYRQPSPLSGFGAPPPTNQSFNQNNFLTQPIPRSVPPDQGALHPQIQPHLFRPVSPNTSTDTIQSASIPPSPSNSFYTSDWVPDENVAPSHPPLTTPPLVQPPLTAFSPPPPAASPPAPPAAAPPKGGQSNSFRLGNLKRPTYAQPPDLTTFAPTISMASTVPPPAPAPAPASLFVPSAAAPTAMTPRDVTAAAPTAMAPRDVTAAAPASAMGPRDVTDNAASSPALPSYQSPVPVGQTSPPTVPPPTVASVSYGQTYRPPYHHWFYKKQRKSTLITEEVSFWQPMSMVDSMKLEEAFTSLDISADTKVATEGGRYDVEVLRRLRSAVYWEEEPGEVRRCSWFVKGSLDSRYIPYEEKIATMLEEEYRIASTSNEWNRVISLGEGEEIILHSATAIAHHVRSSSPDAWGNPPNMQKNPRVVKRGLDEFNFPEDEPETVDHLLFLVHGIGQYCDLKFRYVTEVVDDFRSVSLQLLQSHFRDATEMGTVNRVEVLPVTWHKALHTEDIDRKLHNITLSSIHRLRQFTNDTLLDILFYTSPVFCETIVQAVGNELNRLYTLFKERNPQFKGGVSLGGHSLGSLILFDMLSNQTPDQAPEDQSSTTFKPEESTDSEEVNKLGCLKSPAKLNRGVSYVTIGKSGTGQPFIRYPQLTFHPKNFFALGSPIGMFVTVRGIDSLGEDFRFPTCPAFYNIFHPFDPVAYRVETLIRPELHDLQPVLIPHHKGRKRMHLELKDTMAHMGAALKQRLVDSVRTTWNTVYQMAMFHRTDDNEIEQEVNKVLEDQLIRQQAEANRVAGGDDQEGLEITVGSLNRGRRIDYVLQEAPLESFNEYLFALSSHVCYWESEDTMLMILKEIYATMEITPDNQVLQQILPFETGERSDAASGGHYLPPVAGRPIGMDPTAPPADNPNIGPPPMSGFVRSGH
ncbi:SEC23-interacting protein [Nilaparvata lugens]|uniref:SEC23-interacting protein n=1 Tax=Nilaparvata lugens TaxID=108931 RepID=UPI00193D5091|nr:SEC23-interacting protein [Nilaparvata lugens]